MCPIWQYLNYDYNLFIFNIKWKWKSLSHVPFFATPWTILYYPWNSPGQNTGVGSLSILQGIFTSQGSNPGLLHCRRILYQLSPKGSYDFSSSHVWIWELDYKESWVLKNWCFWTVVLEKTLESPLDSKKIQLVDP